MNAVQDDASAAAPSRARYRADIDGLRAVAVLSVVLTHARIPGFSGGFVGVDIFFVISGFLIYRDLVTRLREGRLSLFGFYGRRMRRTLPALYLVGLATLAGALCVMMPGDLDEMARSLVATILLVPNIFFLTQSGYFDAAAGTKPLLHAWSLGVEEQFYVFAPLLPLALLRLSPVARRAAVMIGFATALVGCIALRDIAQAAAFYLMPARVFEFLVGAALVEGLAPSIRRAWVAEAIAIAAFFLLILSILLFTDATPHPGLLTLVPCVATAAIIHVGATRSTLIGSMLGLRIPAFIGLISYSLYLWHWPILVLSRAADLDETPVVLCAQLALLFVLSILSWRFVETPFRSPGSIWRRRAPVVLPVGAGCLAASAVAIVALHGLPQRFPPEIASIASYYAYRDQKPFREGICFITSKNRLSDFDRSTCLKLRTDAPNVLLLGDSHAAHLWTGLRHTWPGINVLQATASGCKPVVGTTGATRCTQMMHDMIATFIPGNHLDGLVLGGFWEDADIEPLRRTIETLRPNVGKIVVFGPLPHYDAPLATLVAKDMWRGRIDDVPSHRLGDTAALDARMRRAIAPIATYVSSYEIVCPKGDCRLFAAPGVPMQFDYHHLTPQGVDVLMAAVREKEPNLLTPR